MTHLIRIFAPAFFIAAGTASAIAQGHGLTPERGTEGLESVAFTIENTGELPLSCNVKLAHWYSLELGQAAHGVSLSATFWSNPESGSVLLLNPVGDQMPVERIWCGVAGRSWDTRFEIPLKRRAGEAENDMILACAAAPEGAVLEEATETDCSTR